MIKMMEKRRRKVMKFDEVEMKGKIWAEKLATLPTWTEKDVGRFIYAEDDEKFYIGQSSDFEELALGDASTFMKNNANQTLAGDLDPDGDGTRSLGDGTHKWLEITGVTFTGVVTTATYADLAEKYTIGGFDDEFVPIGTLLEVAYEEEFDLTPTTGLSDCFVGVVSEKPGFVLNQEADGQLVGLVGRVPIRIIGPVNKRDIIVPGEHGCGYADNQEELIYKVAVALETNLSYDEKLVECIIK
jgi:hypothetical protein